MNEKDLILEVGCDEIPARYLPLAIRDLKMKAADALADARMTFAQVKSYGTPRRLVLWVMGLSENSRDDTTKVRGPSKKAAYDQDGNPTKALLGFAKSLGIDPSAVTIEEVAGGEYVHGERRKAGRPAVEVLAEVLPQVVLGLESPYPLRWGDQNWRWYRPIRWVVALLDSDIIPMSIAGISSGRTTLGHRTLHPGPLEIPSAAGYFDVMDSAFVVVDPARRAKIIVEGAKDAAKGLQGESPAPLIDEDLLSEVTSLCERPAPFLGHFDAVYSALPKEVLITAMKHHQRYFPVEDSHGNILPGFIGVRDGDTSYSIETVRSGNEWVLRARLKDAQFFFDQDRKVRLEDRLPELAGVRFLRNSGTMLDKARRLERLVVPVASALGILTPEEMDDDNPPHYLADKAARLAKADLVTSLVREFPELEGVMGGCYAEIEGLPSVVSAALRDQYLPRGAKDRLPERGIPSAIALADKLDTLAVAFSLGMEVSGSADPFALRRNALGVVGILMGTTGAGVGNKPVHANEDIEGCGYDADISKLTTLSLELATEVVPNPAPERATKLLQFLMNRVEGVLTERGLGIEVTRAVLGGEERRIVRLSKMTDALASLVGTPKLADVVTGWRRTSVLAKGVEGAGKISHNLLTEEPEKALYLALDNGAPILDRLYESGEYAQYLDLLATLRKPVDTCLDEVLINAEDAAVRANRLALLKSVSTLFTRFADFSHVLPLVGKEK